MKWVIWNKTKDLFWNKDSKDWTNRYYATKFSMEELEAEKLSIMGSGDLILAMIAINV